MQLTISPSKLTGTVKSPPSKSMTHRAIFAAALSNGNSVINNVSASDDIETTFNAVKAIGCKLFSLDKTVKVVGIGQKKDFINDEELNICCLESGSTLRFLIPIIAAFGINARIFGKGRLLERPIKPYVDSFRDKGVNITKELDFIHISGKLVPGKFTIDGSLSSQFVTGLLLALPILNGDSEIEIVGNLGSKPYVDMTIDVLKFFGIVINEIRSGYQIFGNQTYKSCNYTVEGDYSQAAFFEVLGCINPVKIKGLKRNSYQGDKIMLNLIESCGANVEWQDNAVVVKPGNRLKAFRASVINTPDLAPAMSVLACMCEGSSKIEGISRLKLKESDRIVSTTSMIKSLGGEIKVFDNYMIVEGVKKLAGGTVDSYNDHRIVMAASIAAAYSKDPVKILNAQSVNKSYPNFFEDYKSLGGVVNGINLE